MNLPRDARLLFVTRALRMFAYSMLSVVLVLYLSAAGWTEREIGWLLSLALAGDIAVSLLVTSQADAFGRRRMLIASAMLMLVTGAAFALTRQVPWLLAMGAIGVLSPSDKEVGPFLSLEQAALAQLVSEARRTAVFAWYNLVGSFAAALGAFAGGWLVEWARLRGATGADVYHPVIVAYAAAGGALALLFAAASSAVEGAAGAAPAPGRRLGLHRSRRVVLRLAALFSLDAFAGGFIIQSVSAWWFHLRFGLDPKELGTIFLVANLLAGFSALGAGWLAARIGLVRTMVFTHLPSNVMLLAVPLMPDLPLAAGVFLLRFSISQMDVPTRQALTMALVAPDERSAAAGVTAVARSVGAAVSPAIAAWMLAVPALWSGPMLVAGSLKIVYDLLLYRTFRRIEPPRNP